MLAILMVMLLDTTRPVKFEARLSRETGRIRTTQTVIDMGTRLAHQLAAISSEYHHIDRTCHLETADTIENLDSSSHIL